MGSAFSKNKAKVQDLAKQLKDAQAKSGKADEELKAKDKEIQAAKELQSKATAEAEQLRQRNAEIERANNENLSALQSSIKANNEAADKRSRDLEDQVSSLTKERDRLGVHAKAAEYAQKRHKKELEDVRAEQAESQSTAAQKTRDVLDQRRRDLEGQTLLLIQQRDKAQSERDNHELRNRALEYSNKRDKKAADEAHEQEKDGLRQAHTALLNYHNQAKQDWAGVLWEKDHESSLQRMRKDAALRSLGEAQKLQYENDALRMQKNVLKGEYDKAYALKYQVEGLQLQKQALHSEYDKAHALHYQVEGLQLQKQALRSEYDKLLNLKLENDALRMQKNVLYSEYEKLLGLKLQVDALKLQKEALAKAHGDSSKLNAMIAPSHQLHRDLNDFHAHTQKQLADTQKRLATSEQMHESLKHAHANLIKQSSERFSKQASENEATRQNMTKVQKAHDAAIEHHRGVFEAMQKDVDDHKSQIEKLKGDHAVSTEAHSRTQGELASQLSDAKANIARLEKEATDRRDSGMKIDSPQLQQNGAVTYNTDHM